MEILWNGTVSVEFRKNYTELWGYFDFPQNFHTRKLGEITVFYAVANIVSVYLSDIAGNFEAIL